MKSNVSVAQYGVSQFPIITSGTWMGIKTVCNTSSTSEICYYVVIPIRSLSKGFPTSAHNVCFYGFFRKNYHRIIMKYSKYKSAERRIVGQLEIGCVSPVHFVYFQSKKKDLIWSS